MHTFTHCLLKIGHVYQHVRFYRFKCREREKNIRIGVRLHNENRRDESKRYFKEGANVSNKMAIDLIEVQDIYIYIYIYI